MKSISNSTIINVAIVLFLFLAIMKLLQFYGVGVNVYGSYIAFYIFLIVSTYILPKEYPEL
jgi:hypothetical protein